jgi:hypothetical protein
MKNILIGDSHSNFTFIDNCEFFVCSGGSAKGLNNSNSISKYNESILQKVQSTNYDVHIFMFGGVDIDFSFIHKFIHNPKINFFIFNGDVINNYIEFIKTHFSNKRTIILSVGLPTLDDDHLKIGLLNGHINYLENYDPNELKRQLEGINLPNIVIRSLVVLNFNEQLKRKIEQLNSRNIKFLDVTSFTFDNSNKRIHDNYFTRSDHHNYERNKHFNEIINNFIKINFPNL